MYEGYEKLETVYVNLDPVCTACEGAGVILYRLPEQELDDSQLLGERECEVCKGTGGNLELLRAAGHNI